MALIFPALPGLAWSVTKRRRFRPASSVRYLGTNCGRSIILIRFGNLLWSTSFCATTLKLATTS